MIGGVTSLVLTGRDTSACGFAPGLEHFLRSTALGCAGGLRDHAGYGKPVPVLHGGVTHIAKLRLSPAALR